MAKKGGKLPNKHDQTLLSYCLPAAALVQTGVIRAAPLFHYQIPQLLTGYAGCLKRPATPVQFHYSSHTALVCETQAQSALGSAAESLTQDDITAHLLSC